MNSQSTNETHETNETAQQSLAVICLWELTDEELASVAGATASGSAVAPTDFEAAF